MLTIQIGHRGYDKVFGWKEADFDEAFPIISIDFPATTYELLDILERAKLDAESEMYMSLLPDKFSYLVPDVNSIDDLFILNEASKRMCDMDTNQLIALTALAQTATSNWKNSLSASRLYDLTCSVDQCCVIPSAPDLYHLGQHYIRNDLLQQYSSLPQSVKDALNCELIGAQVFYETNGIFIENRIGFAIPYKGYVIQTEDIIEASQSLDLNNKPPEYSIRVQARCSEGAKFITLDLPMAQDELHRRLSELDPEGQGGLDYYCVDCRIVSLIDIVKFYASALNEPDFDQLNDFARGIAALSYDEAIEYGAAILLRKPENTNDAIRILKEVGEYILLPEIRSAEDYGKYELNRLLDAADTVYILEHLDLEAYGDDLLKNRDVRLTPYGAIERKDGLPIYALSESQDYDHSNMGEMLM